MGEFFEGQPQLQEESNMCAIAVGLNINALGANPLTCGAATLTPPLTQPRNCKDVDELAKDVNSKFAKYILDSSKKVARTGLAIMDWPGLKEGQELINAVLSKNLHLINNEGR